MKDIWSETPQWKIHPIASREYGGEEYILDGRAVSDVGCVRTNNEDNFILRETFNENAADRKDAGTCMAHPTGRWNCFAVFDGMGGGEKGEEASRIAAEEILSVMKHLGEYADCRQVDEAVRAGFRKANEAIVRLQQESRVYGTTGTVCCMDGESFKIYHLGDSRAYLFREGQLFLLTRDQTVARMKLDAGFYDKDDPRIEVEQHQLTEYIGCDPTTEAIRPVESQWIDLQNGDCWLLCSDGLYDMCTDTQIENILKKESIPDDAAGVLVKEAIASGGRDNVTCIVAKVTKKSYS